MQSDVRRRLDTARIARPDEERGRELSLEAQNITGDWYHSCHVVYDLDCDVRILTAQRMRQQTLRDARESSSQ